MALERIFRGPKLLSVSGIPGIKAIVKAIFRVFFKISSLAFSKVSVCVIGELVLAGIAIAI